MNNALPGGRQARNNPATRFPDPSLTSPPTSTPPPPDQSGLAGLLSGAGAALGGGMGQAGPAGMPPPLNSAMPGLANYQVPGSGTSAPPYIDPTTLQSLMLNRSLGSSQQAPSGLAGLLSGAGSAMGGAAQAALPLATPTPQPYNPGY